MAQLKLSNSITSKGDLQRLARELDSLNDFFISAQARAPGSAVQAPKSSKLLEEVAAENNLKLLDKDQRTNLLEELKRLVKEAPDVHMSFATEPTPRDMLPLVTWLRENIHPQLLVSVGYQPKIAAGCMLRTPNRIIDMSLGTHMAKQSALLTHLIQESFSGS